MEQNTNIQTYETEPNFSIYRDGQLDRMYEAKKLTRLVAHSVGHIAYTGLKNGFDAFDTFVVAMNQEFNG